MEVIPSPKAVSEPSEPSEEEEIVKVEAEPVVESVIEPFVAEVIVEAKAVEKTVEVEKKPDIIAEMIEQKSVNMGRRRMAGSFLPDNVCEVYKEMLISEVPVKQEVKKEVFVE